MLCISVALAVTEFKDFKILQRLRNAFRSLTKGSRSSEQPNDWGQERNTAGKLFLHFQIITKQYMQQLFMVLSVTSPADTKAELKLASAWMCLRCEWVLQSAMYHHGHRISPTAGERLTRVQLKQSLSMFALSLDTTVLLQCCWKIPECPLYFPVSVVCSSSVICDFIKVKK